MGGGVHQDTETLTLSAVACEQALWSEKERRDGEGVGREEERGRGKGESLWTKD